MNQGSRPAACEISCAILPSSRWYFAENVSPSRTSPSCPRLLMAKELMGASPPKNQAKPGRKLPAPARPNPATSPQPRSGLQASAWSRFTFDHSRAAFSAGSGVRSVSRLSRSSAACVTRSRQYSGARASSLSYTAQLESRRTAPPAITIGISCDVACFGSKRSVNCDGTMGASWAGCSVPPVAKGEPT